MKFIDIFILFVPTDVLNIRHVLWNSVFSRTVDLMDKDLATRRILRGSRLTKHEHRVLSRGLQLIQL